MGVPALNFPMKKPPAGGFFVSGIEYGIVEIALLAPV